MVTKQGQHPRLVVSMTDEDVIGRVAEMWGTAAVPLKPQKAHHKPAFKASIYGRRALEWMLRLRPLLGERRRARIDEIQAAWVDRPVRRKLLHPHQVAAIVQALKAGERAVDIADRHEIRRESVYRLARRQGSAPTLEGRGWP